MAIIDSIKSETLKQLITEKGGDEVSLTQSQINEINEALLDQNMTTVALKPVLNSILPDVKDETLNHMLQETTPIVFKQLSQKIQKNPADLKPLFSFMKSDRGGNTGYGYLVINLAALNDIDGLSEEVFKPSMKEVTQEQLFLRMLFIFLKIQEILRTQFEEYLGERRDLVEAIIRKAKEEGNALLISFFDENKTLRDIDILHIHSGRFANRKLAKGDYRSFKKQRDTQAAISAILEKDDFSLKDDIGKYLADSAMDLNLPFSSFLNKRLLEEGGSLMVSPDRDELSIILNLTGSSILRLLTSLYRIHRKDNEILEEKADELDVLKKQLHDHFVCLLDKYNFQEEALLSHQAGIDAMNEEFGVDDIFSVKLGKSMFSKLYSWFRPAEKIEIHISVEGQSISIQEKEIKELLGKKYPSYLSLQQQGSKVREKKLFDEEKLRIKKEAGEVIGFSVPTKETEQLVEYDAKRDKYILYITDGNSINDTAYRAGLIALGLKHKELNVFGIEPDSLQKTVAEQLKDAGVQVKNEQPKSIAAPTA